MTPEGVTGQVTGGSVVPVNVEVDLGRFGGAPSGLLRSAVVAVLRDAGVGGEVSLALIDDPEITRLNRRYLGKDRPTDVIAFSLGEEFDPLGDVYVGVEEARRQAEARGISLDEELVRLAVHGTLHVLGHDHPEGSDRETAAMFVLQERIVGEVMANSADRSVRNG